MGGSVNAMGAREAASALRWWLESGVDVAIQDLPRNWFERDLAPPAAEPKAPKAPEALPETLEAFREWLSTSPEAPLASARSRAVLPRGVENAEVMVLCDPPTREELASGEPIGGEPGALMKRMLAAIGMADRAYSANLACFHSPGSRLSPEQIEHCAAAGRRHVALVRPKRLLLLGDLTSQALLGKPMLQARGHVHKVEGIRTIASFHPRQLLKRPSDKALAWKDLLLLTEESP